MANYLKRLCALLLALVMCGSMFCTTAFAAETINGNTWYGKDVAVDVTAGTEGYTYMSLFRKYAHGYEFSGHFLGDGEGPQTFVVIDTVEHDGTTWTPSGIYDPMNSNYDVTYCCDVETMIVDGTYYKRLNLEDSEYYNDAKAAQIRSIVTNSYPYVTLEAMKADLAKSGYAYAEELTRNEIIAAVQTAIWACANTNGEPMRYAKSYKVSDNLQWGYPLHDTSAESGLDVSGKRVFKTYEEVGTRIDSLVDYLLAQNATYADKAQIIISDLKMVGAPVVRSNETTYTLEITLNNSGSGYNDNINITVTAGENEQVIPVKLGQEKYTLQINAKRGDEIKAVVSGTQVLPAGVYFYSPKAADANGDGVATSREVSQNLVGVAMGETPVYAEATMRFDEVTFKSGEVSNISYMFINKETGEVEFIKKIDVEEGATSAPIITADGYVSVIFMKQGTSGMFWFSEKVDEAAQNAAIQCLKDNNPSYKGHNAIAFGEGEHQLEFKKNKFVTYTFSAASVDIDDEDVPGAATPETTEPPATEPPATEPPATEPPATEPATTFHNESKTHLLGDAEGDLTTFNFKVVKENIPAAGEERYAVVGSGEQTEFWTAYLIKGGDLKVTNKNSNTTSYAYNDNAKKINGIYLDGVFYPADSDAISYPGKEEGKSLVANYNGLQQAMLMNGNGKKVAVYCADHVISTTSEALYNVVNIEDAEHFNDATASKIRAVAVNGYWGGTETVDQYGSLAKLKAKMAASGLFTPEEINHLTPGAALSATQFAIWELANDDDNRQVVNVQYIQKNRVAGYNGKSWNTLKVTPESEIACVDLIFKLSHYLTTLPGISASEMSTADTVLNYKNILKDVNIEVVKKAKDHENNADTNKDNDAYITNVTFDILKVSEKDNLVAKIVDANGNVYATGRIAGEKQEGEVELNDNGNGTYTFEGVTLIENAETTYTVVVEGVQYLERNVYLYFAGERETSQTLIGYDEGEFTVNVESSIKKTFNVDEPETPPTVSFNNGDASNISFMLIDANGNVEFLKKYDIGNETSFEIPTEEGKVSAVFVKQSTSGMFWFSQEVDEAVVNATIECLKANNPSYKGHNAVAFGEGEHDLEFKKNKFVTYNFEGDFAEVALNPVVLKAPAPETPAETEAPTEPETVPEETEAPTEPETVPEETEAPTEPETVPEETEAPTEPETVPEETEAPTEPETVPEETEAPKVTMKGAQETSRITINGVVAIYIAGDGKIPGVIWTSVEVDDATKTAIIDALGADADAVFVSGIGSHVIEYQHNKNKTKTVTYTFE